MIRRANESDARRLAQVHLDTVLVAYAAFFHPDAPKPQLDELEREWLDLVRSPGATAFLATDGAEDVGTVAFRLLEGDACELLRLHVLPSRWGAGLGRQLHDRALDAARGLGARRVQLPVLEANDRARAMYEHLGWTLDPAGTFTGRHGLVELTYRRDL